MGLPMAQTTVLGDTGMGSAASRVPMELYALAPILFERVEK